jgi:HAMP domain-containing protein
MEPEVMLARTRTINLVTRLLFAIVIVGLLPLAGVTVSAMIGFGSASDRALGATSAVLDDVSLKALELRTGQSALELGQFLNARAGDVRSAALLSADPAIWSDFSAAHSGELWYATGTSAAPGEQRETFPLYRELVAIDGDGRVLARVADSRLQVDPGDSAGIAAYLTEARALAPGAIGVSHLSRRYMPRPADEAARAPGADYATFDGVYRFIAARRGADGSFTGAVMLALDARHVMERVIHILPTHDSRWAVWPDYGSGNYAYLFDDQGWTIAHPRLWTVRGDDAAGQAVPPVAELMSNEERDRHPFNARLGGWANPNLPEVHAKGMAGELGFVTTVNQQGVRKVTTYAPVPFTEGSYSDGGVFAVVAIGANMAEFHRASTIVAGAIDDERERLQFRLALVVILALALLALMGMASSRMIVRPLAQLTTAARQLERGEFDEAQLVPIRQRRFSDEVTILADVFADMGRQVVKREKQLRTEIADLHIQIDTGRRQQQVDEIVETDYFRNLRDTASKLRARTKTVPVSEGDPV